MSTQSLNPSRRVGYEEKQTECYYVDIYAEVAQPAFIPNMSRSSRVIHLLGKTPTKQPSPAQRLHLGFPYLTNSPVNMAAISDLPETITVKRKRDKDGRALDYLCFEDYANKRHKGTSDEGNSNRNSVGWIYRRRKVLDPESAENIPPQIHKGPDRPGPAGPPAIQISKLGDENRPIKPLRQKKAAGNDWNMDSSPVVPAPAFLGEDIRNARRFHLTRSQPTLLTAGVIGSRVSKKRSTIFVERTGAARLGKASHNGQRDSRIRTEEDVDMASLKEDGDYHSVGIEQLTRDMDAFVLEQVNQNLASIEEEKKKEQARAARAAARSQLRPKGQAPGQRIFEREPALVAQLDKGRTGISAPGSGDADVDMMDSDEDDYVLETYVRVPTSQLTEVVKPHQVGLLVFDSEPDRLEFFYGNEDDSEDEVLEDGDDENAEGHYSTEYPDEDLEWDDETGQNAYSYLTQNASDLEEFDEVAFMEQAWDKNLGRSVEDKILQRDQVGVSGHTAIPHSRPGFRTRLPSHKRLGGSMHRVQRRM
ncbi:hypothetical protein P8C59_004693 [Phyllachora maydis]|uniref:Transcription factor Iwr1 domain-containing protein n=1 Tax=Phyllachora maydis TaxID=1825666 RepID=A0AAD9I445_9PEZI|nr:hypothetical protein P8C59_004693 [Phyllachora maydis]